MWQHYHHALGWWSEVAHISHGALSFAMIQMQEGCAEPSSSHLSKLLPPLPHAPLARMRYVPAMCSSSLPKHVHALPQVLTPADEVHHTNKHNFKVPFVCGCRDLGEALRRIAEGAAMIRTKVGGKICG